MQLKSIVYNYFDLELIYRVPETSNTKATEENCLESTKRILQLQMELIKSEEKIRSLEQKLTACRKQRDEERKISKHYKNLYEKQQNMPVIHSNALNVSCFKFYQR